MHTFKVIHVYPFINRKGGVERYLCELIPALVRKGFGNLEIATGEVDPSVGFSQPIKKLPFIKKPYFLSSLSFGLLSHLFLKKNKQELLHVQGANRFRQDVVTAHSVHKAWFLRSIKEVKPFSKAWFLKVLNPVHYATMLIETIQYRTSHVKKVIAISDLVKQEVQHYFGYPNDQIEVIYSGVNTVEFSPENSVKKRAEIRSQYGFNDDDIVMIFVGNEFKRKGLETTLEAMTLLKESRLKLLVAGKADPSYFRKRAEVLGVNEQVSFIGSRSDLNFQYGASDLLVLPTQYEAFGLVITEAMAAGLPVVVSKDAGASELIEPDKEGILLTDPKDSKELADGIAKLFDKQTRQQMGYAARQKALQYTWDEVADAHIKLYKSMQP